MTTPVLRPGRLWAMLRQLGRAIPRPIPWRRAAASGVPPTRLAHNGPVGIAYDVRGHGRPLVLVQGVGIGRWGWEPVADRLARRFRVITVDNRGIGASDTPPGHFSTRSMAQDVLAVLDHAGIQQASVLGTSLGGMVAQELALAHPERVDRLVLVATVPGGPHSRPMPLGTTYLFAVSPFLTDKARLRQFVNNALGPSILRRRPKIARRLAAAKLAHPQSQGAWRAQVAAGMLFNPLGRQRDLTQPALIVQGTADRVVDPGNAEALADLLPNAQVKLLEGAGHLLYWEQPRRFARMVAGFLTEPATSTRRSTWPVRRAS
ncbi:MAG TPA: alpha/beta fold hydrolase [Actinomycetota bacterium]|nr:alpha/beta fold hydrolase [Actinomycetota bacterium]